MTSFCCSSLSRLSCCCFHVLIKGFPFPVFLLSSFSFIPLTLLFYACKHKHAFVHNRKTQTRCFSVVFFFSPCLSSFLLFLTLNFLESCSPFFSSFVFTTYSISFLSISLSVSLTLPLLSVSALPHYLLAVKCLFLWDKSCDVCV